MSSKVSVTLVALPIGNPLDLSARGAKALTEADIIFCEDTRKMDELAERAQLKLRAVRVALPGSREFEIDWISYLEKAAPGEKWVMVSDAGTPVLNDPGKSLIDFSFQKNLELVAVPGPSAPIMALQWGGGFGLPFIFAGFVPKAEGEQSAVLKTFFSLMPTKGSFCFFDTKHQVVASLEFLAAQGLGTHKLIMAREMTKKHEELLRSTVQEVLADLKMRIAKDKPIGELTFILEGYEWGLKNHRPLGLEDIVALRTLAPKQAAKLAARLISVPVSECYDAFVKGKTNHEV